MFSRIAVVNRGQAAVRLIRAVRELDAEHGTRTRPFARHTGDPEAAVAPAEGAEQAKPGAEPATLRAPVCSAGSGDVAAGVEAVHDIERARRVGSVNDIVRATALRPHTSPLSLGAWSAPPRPRSFATSDGQKGPA